MTDSVGSQPESDRIARLEATIQDLQHQLDRLAAATPPDAADPASEPRAGRLGRRSLLAGAAAAAAVGTVAFVGKAEPAAAAANLLADATADQPGLFAGSATGQACVYGAQGGTGPGVWGNVTNGANTDAGVVGLHVGGGPGVLGGSASGPGLRATSATGNGIDATVTGAASTSSGAVISTVGLGKAVSCSLTNSANTSAALLATTAGTGAALQGTSSLGRGAVLRGKVAQLQLFPRPEAPPASGKPGDLYARLVDSRAQLWFCRNGTRWVQIA
jgi:hypothetical protein